MLSDLEVLGIASRTAILLVADHGEELFERGTVGHGENLHRETTRVPLAMLIPDLAPARIPVSAELCDVYATLLDLAGIAPDVDARGESLLPYAVGGQAQLGRATASHLPGRAAALHLNRYHFLTRVFASDEVYDVETDPSEQHNLIGERPIVERYLRTALGYEQTFGAAWSRIRWGASNNVTRAFAADHE
jgi:choline-sulfatase